MPPVLPPAATALVPPKILSGKEVYDALMQEIEPELISDNIPKLKEQYKNETPEEWQKRKKKYNDAFAKLYEKYDSYLADLDQRIHRYHRETVGAIEKQSRAGEERAIDQMFSASMLSFS